ncbi:hypothetical protein [Thalassobacillus devorans]|uniref:hypothetical protein n=1 Tax=Thalassobacillus devorans TaxID=279813 RepID=UPI001594430D|nr:hypothetical protein [Thalassobacillus devorans]
MIANVCPHYMKAVGPADPGLFDEYLEHFPDNYPLKKSKTEYPDTCERCAVRYKKSSNRQKYCEACREEIKREQAKKRMKNKRLKDSTNK